MELTAQEFQRLAAKRKVNKYRNKEVNIHFGINVMKFDSIKEYKRWLYLADCEKNGTIKDLQRQVEYVLSVNEQKICSYISDFKYLNLKVNEIVVEDVKSSVTRKLPVYRLKKKLMKAIWNIDIKEI